ncbi:hypothetical protein KIN20_027760 [Parelaphostrongylus tenuis]|uniref:Uncharacterized protein n=1 Tax=Parelaphostrongylus tenuis TaxID=148309 RepID=A0AAD5WE19_PARTN|nr:hypothetical protein KIN20_027760 [Parelaphostrongylus tenuis]
MARIIILQRQSVSTSKPLLNTKCTQLRTILLSAIDKVFYVTHMSASNPLDYRLYLTEIKF